MAHAYHGDLGPEGTLYFDGCEECEERADQGIQGLLNLEPIRAEVLWRRMIVTERGKKARVENLPGYSVQKGYLSNAEARAGRQLYYLAVMLERSGDSRAWIPGKFFYGGEA
jgi:hypothetical protein